MIYVWPMIQLRRRLPLLGVRGLQFGALASGSSGGPTHFEIVAFDAFVRRAVAVDVFVRRTVAKDVER